MSRFIRYAKVSGYVTERYLWFCGVEIRLFTSNRSFANRRRVYSLGGHGRRSFSIRGHHTELRIGWTTLRGKLHRRRSKRDRLARIAAYEARYDEVAA